jgi:predicted GIY-YIG superfamily endonuclease
MKTRIAYIYVLLCPETNKIRYVGKSFNPERRYKKHINKKRKTYCCRWIQTLKQRNLKPKLKILLITDENYIDFWEKRIIKQFKKYYDLTNLTDGGDGGDTISNHPNKEDIIRRAKLHRIPLVGEKNPMYGRKLNQEEKDKIGKSVKAMYDNGSIILPRKTEQQISVMVERLRKYNYVNTIQGRKKNIENNTLAKNPNASVYLFIDAEGIKYTVTGNLKNFCKEHKIRRTSILSGLRSLDQVIIKGWTCIKKGKNRLLNVDVKLSMGMGSKVIRY